MDIRFKNIPAKKRSTEVVVKNLFQKHFFLTPDSTKTINKKKYLIVNGDDLCKDETTNQKIIAAYKEGILTSTSAFINFEDSVTQIREIHDVHPTLPIGLHLNLTLGSPVLKPNEVPRLTDKNGQFFTIDSIIKHLINIPIEDVKKELYAQIEKFIKTGVPLDHINYHHHIAALYTPFFKIVREIAQKYKVPLRNPVPASIYKLIRLNGNGGGGTTGIRKLLQFALIHPLKLFPILKYVKPASLVEQVKLMTAEKIITTDWFIDSFYANESTINLISILEQLPNGISEMMCHPGNGQELEVLTDPKVKHTIDKLNIHLISWNHLV